MERYRQSFLVSTIIMCLICAQLLFVGLTTLNVWQIGISTAILGLWLLAYFCLSRSIRGGFALSFVINNLMWLLLLMEILRRARFVDKYNSFEGPNGYGSPVAFFLGLMFEGFFFLMFSLILVRGTAVIFSRKAK